MTRGRRARALSGQGRLARAALRMRAASTMCEGRALSAAAHSHCPAETNGRAAPVPVCAQGRGPSTIPAPSPGRGPGGRWGRGLNAHATFFAFGHCRRTRRTCHDARRSQSYFESTRKRPTMAAKRAQAGYRHDATRTTGIPRGPSHLRSRAELAAKDRGRQRSPTETWTETQKRVLRGDRLMSLEANQHPPLPRLPVTNAPPSISIHYSSFRDSKRGPGVTVAHSFSSPSTPVIAMS